MTINELRIGNIITDEEGNICKVRAIDGDRFVTHKGKDYHGSVTVYIDKYSGTIGKWVAKLNGIPLTPEWLAKCRFTPNDKMPWLLCRGNFVLNTGNHNIWHWGNSVMRDMEYVHELQNAFFAMTGREVDIEL